MKQALMQQALMQQHHETPSSALGGIGWRRDSRLSQHGIATNYAYHCTRHWDQYWSAKLLKALLYLRKTFYFSLMFF